MNKQTVEVCVPTGNRELHANVPSENLIGVYLPKPLKPVANAAEEIKMAIREGLVRSGISLIAAPGRKVAIAVTDRTRLTPNSVILPALLDELNTMGIKDSDVTVLIGTGVHTPDNHADIEKNVGREVMDRVEILNNRPFEQVHVEIGKTSYGTPVQVHHKFAETDIKIATGNIVPCLMAGWTGGGKTVLPGVTSKETIYINHKLSMDQLQKANRASLLGVLPPENIVRADIEEAAKLSGLQLAINTVLNEDNQLVKVVAGEHVAIHRDGVNSLLDSLKADIPEKADIVVAGVGSAGFEISLYQGASRAIQSLDEIIKVGGTVIVPCECREGIYEGILKQKYTDWMKKMPTPEEIRTLTRADLLPPEEGVVLYPYSWLLHNLKCRMIVVTDGMSKLELAEVHMQHATTLQEAIDEAIRYHGPGARISILPYAGRMIPRLLEY